MKSATMHHAAAITETPPRAACWIAACCVPAALGLEALLASAINSQVAPTHLAGTWVGLTLLAAAATGAYADARWCVLPNWLTYSTAAWGLLINAFQSIAGDGARWIGGVGMADSLTGFVALFALMLVVFSFTGGGAGDVKFAGAIGALTGFSRGVEILLIAFVVAGACTLIAAVYRLGPANFARLALRQAFRLCCRGWYPSRLAPRDDLQESELLRTQMPLGPFFAFGMVAVAASPLA